MNFSKRFELMAENLKANRAIKIMELIFNPPALEAEIEQAKTLAKGVLPAGVESFFREMNGFNLEWEHNVESIKQDNDFDKGFIKILPILDIFGNWKDTTWFEGSEGADEYKPVKPLDYFAPEACAAFYQTTEEIPLNTVYYHYFGEYQEDTRYTFEEYIDRLLASRGYFYWIQTLCKGLQKSNEVAVFRNNMPLIFDDYNDDLFHPKKAG
ncbi:hypothetical protein [Nostoc sp.]|uniref:hypothetical protein n=1 Tax=Nostoc sp. TaxID=1180 RepID=UPI002FF90F8A